MVVVAMMVRVAVAALVMIVIMVDAIMMEVIMPTTSAGRASWSRPAATWCTA